MSDGESWPTGPSQSAVALIESAQHFITASPNELDTDAVEHIGTLLMSIEHATPGGAPLHAQLDTVRKWVEALGRSHEHARFGGTANIRDHVFVQLRLARAAIEDYLRETR